MPVERDYFKSMENKKIINKIKKSIEKLYNESDDKYLFDCKVCERCLMFRLAHYLQFEFPDYFVDCEFNKMGFNGHKSEAKVEPIYNGNGLKKMYADIIIHKRGSRIEDNLVCLELKINKHGVDSDLIRLQNMTKADGFQHKGINYVYNYDLGFFVYLPKDKSKLEIRIFENGKMIK